MPTDGGHPQTLAKYALKFKNVRNEESKMFICPETKIN